MARITSEQVGEFIREHGVACGGNWAAMAMHALKNGAPDKWNALPDNVEYSFA